MAANDELTRLRAEIKELRDKHDHVQDVNRGLQAAVERWIHDARQEGVARLRAEDQAEDERDHRLAVEQDFHRRTLDFMGAVTDAAKAARVSPVPGTAGADATPREAAARLSAPQDLVAFRSDMDVAALLALALQYGRQATDADTVGKAAARRGQSARAQVKQSREEQRLARCREVVAVTLLDATRQVLHYRTSHAAYATVSGFIRHINANLPRGATQLAFSTSDVLIRDGWTLVHAHGSTELGDAKIERDLLDRRKRSKIKPVDDCGMEINTGEGSPRAEPSALEFVLGDRFEADLLAKLNATGKSVVALVREATGRQKPEEVLEARKAEVADLEKQIGAVDSKLDQAQRRIAELEERPQPKTPEQVLNSAWASVSERASAADTVLGKLVSEKNWDEIKETLKMLGRMDVDVSVLTSCGIGKTVNKLKKAEDGDVQTLAKALVKKWKDLVAAQS